ADRDHTARRSRASPLSPAGTNGGRSASTPSALARQSTGPAIPGRCLLPRRFSAVDNSDIGVGRRLNTGPSPRPNPDDIKGTTLDHAGEAATARAHAQHLP